MPWSSSIIPLNPVDVLIAGVIVLYAVHGYQRGWLLSTGALAGFALALFVGLVFYAPLAGLLVENTPAPYGLAKPFAFLLVWIVTDLLAGSLIRSALRRESARRGRSTTDRLLGVWPGAVHGLFVGALLLTIATLVPFPAPIVSALQDSRARQRLEPRTALMAEQFSQVFGDAVQETIGLLTVKPQSDQRIPLRFSVPDPRFDPAAEERMLELVNRERAERGLKPLRMDETLRQASREHSRDMLQRGYFAHLTPEGVTPFQRLSRAGVRFQAAGENLALAPNVDVAHSGLMNSTGHRENILSSLFGRVGIGAADGGLHGTVFTQSFAD